MTDSARPVVLVTGVGRRVGIGAGIAQRLARDGWDVALSFWTPYDDRMPWGRQEGDVEDIVESIRRMGARTVAVPADLTRVQAPAELLDAVRAALGPVTALVMCHCESVNSGLLDTSVESFDRHFAVNTRASWLLIREFARRFDPRSVPDSGSADSSDRGSATGSDPDGPGRIVAITSDHTIGNLPYGASKGALDRIVIAAARELEHLRIASNVVNPGPIDTGWMPPEMAAGLPARVPRGRAGRPADTAALVSFLLSADGGWINGQLLYSDGGIWL